LALARHGEPGHAAIPDWPPYSLQGRETMLFDVPSRVQNDPRGGERRLYQRAPFVQRGTM